jgi:lipopolysaccharide/colanic/teichoic acid biosynthesis glycosyltransferase
VASVDVQPRYEDYPAYEVAVADADRRRHFPSVFPPQSSWYTARGKRLLDIVLAVMALVALSPLLIAVAVLVRAKLGHGGVIYRQARLGRDGSVFEIFKFRSMLPDRRAESRPFVGVDRRVNHKSDNDPRHTPFGRFLRATSLDELPQLINVIRGDMSLVGPRPELVTVADRTGLASHPRHRERPGITGLFQVSELRSTNKISAGLHLDIAYVADVRFRRDVAILWRTIGVLFGRRF